MSATDEERIAVQQFVALSDAVSDGTLGPWRGMERAVVYAAELEHAIRDLLDSERTGQLIDLARASFRQQVIRMEN